ncbi:MAG: alpha-L-fucosidase [Candidatus Aminicenantes bacterium]|nr:alpha-L-fucosidase [Candidatus Aminicenantes bacterium]
MKKIGILFLFSLIAAAYAGLSVAAQAGQSSQAASPPAQTPRLALPTLEQAAWHDLELGMFIHFAPNTWQDQEYDDLSTPLAKINPAQLDTDQWVRVAESMGAKYIIFVAKHVGGFCWWQTETTDYSVKSIPWRGGKADVMAMLAESCRGMKLGVYISPADRKHGADVGGRCKTPAEQTRYNAIYRQQLTELLSRYGELIEVWFDGSCIIDVGDLLKKYVPKAMIFQGPQATIRWVGNEDGIAPYPAWNSLPLAAAKSGVATAAESRPDGDAWMPLECDARFRNTWFWNTKNANTLKSVDQLMDMYYKSVGRGAVLLLNHTPDPTGLIPEADAKRAAEFGAEVQRRFGKSTAETSGQGETIELDLGKARIVDHIITMEDIRQGERVRAYTIEALTDGVWREIVKGTAVGHKKIDRFTPVKTSKIWFRTLSSAGAPIIRKLAVYGPAK